MVALQRRAFLIQLAAALGLAVAPAWATHNTPVRLGIWPYHSAQRLFAYYEGLRTQLERSLKRPVRLESAQGVDEFVQRLARQDFDLVVNAPHLSHLLQTDHGWKPVARFVPDNTVYLLTRKQGGVRSIKDLRGKSIATPDRSMLLSLAAEKSLKIGGLSSDAVDWQETGGLASSVFAVTAGQADAAVATLASLALTPQAEVDQLRILADAGKIPQLFVMAAPTMDAQLLRQATAACLAYRKEGKPQMTRLGVSELSQLEPYALQTRRLFEQQLGRN